MLALYIILAIILILILLMLCPITVNIRFEDKLTTEVKFLFLKYKFKNDENNKDKKSKKDKNKKDEKSLKEMFKKQGIDGFLGLISMVVSAAANTIKKIIPHIIISDLELYLVVCENDAASTALKYGKVCSVVYPSMNFLIENTKCKNYDINISPGFEEEKTLINFNLKLKIKLIYGVSSAIYALVKYIGYVKRKVINK